ncbi:MAG: electron transfer flavoprotein-ubiquinone oxidoreductase [Chlorobiaceae bacterium]|nr:electron transfer flavoprotein-ubiquinone oxidoreductase [Chlorobiaceae bacterium]
MHPDRETVDFDIVFVGAGPANLAAAIHLNRLIGKNGAISPEIAIIDKGRYPGAHLLSGAVLDPKALNEFFPDFIQSGCPLEATVSRESVMFLTANKKFSFPFLPEPFSSKGCHLVSLSRIGAWLAEKAQEAGAQIFDSTAAVVPVTENGRLAGIITDDKGVRRNGSRKPGFEPGIILKAKVFVIGEGSRGSLLPQLSEIFPASTEINHEYFSSGVKETWRVPEGRIRAGEIIHLFGYPLPSERYGGGWIYAFSPTLISLGFVTSLGPSSSLCDPHLNLQLFKQHPFLRSILEGGAMLESGARSIASRTFNELPPISGQGFLVTGESAGMVNLQRQKGIHLAMKSGTLAAETIFDCLMQNDFSAERLGTYNERFRNSWAFEELNGAGNYRKAFEKGLYAGLLQAGLRLKFPGFAAAQEKEKNPGFDAFKKFAEGFRPDGSITFNKDEALYRSGTMHEEDQPCHLLIKAGDIETICLEKCRSEYGNPCNHFCPAKVYEVTYEPAPSFRLNPSNCLHCKTCEIADPYGIITWVPPEGGGGPGYKIS